MSRQTRHIISGNASIAPTKEEPIVSVCLELFCVKSALEGIVLRCPTASKVENEFRFFFLVILVELLRVRTLEENVVCDFFFLISILIRR